ncbi:protein trunk-like [Saccostrea echinata]|uniref:protein trunk-like n=1 Tax=Saccostrea echinata TaxID=191078 RepID=UPI002A8100FA|nr:protein trunk-like [Saccostrea echinata]XP_061174951.1 protein trunk-like [Saccostrea echinata]XP_061174952.1 protein trunk-like [Saccostrea echinata]XP_061174953.1 protein trunk-like [Saccostrea echinata]
MISLTRERQTPYYCSNDREMVASPTVLKVQSKYNTFHLLLCVLTMISCANAFPSPIVKQDNNRTVVMFRNQICKPVDPQHLTQRMGEFFDTSKMALDEATVKRSIDDDLLQSDDPNVNDDGLYSDDDSDEEEESSNKKQASSDKNSYIHKYSEDPNHPNYPESMQFMRRKRDTNNFQSVDEFKSHYQLLMESKAKRKQFKRFIRKSKKLKQKKRLPWTCKTKKVWLKMEDGYFPRYIRSAQCKSKKCFFNYYECIPKKYTVTILKRDPTNCNPVPSYGLDTTYEERWFFDKYHVTVFCECGVGSGRRRGKGGRKPRS